MSSAVIDWPHSVWRVPATSWTRLLHESAMYRLPAGTRTSGGASSSADGGRAAVPARARPPGGAPGDGVDVVGGHDTPHWVPGGLATPGSGCCRRRRCTGRRRCRRSRCRARPAGARLAAPPSPLIPAVPGALPGDRVDVAGGHRDCPTGSPVAAATSWTRLLPPSAMYRSPGRVDRDPGPGRSAAPTSPRRRRRNAADAGRAARDRVHVAGGHRDAPLRPGRSGDLLDPVVPRCRRCTGPRPSRTPGPAGGSAATTARCRRHRRPRRAGGCPAIVYTSPAVIEMPPLGPGAPATSCTRLPRVSAIYTFPPL